MKIIKFLKLKRVHLALNLFFCCFFCYVIRTSFSLQLVAMVQHTNTSKNEDYGPRYPWGEQTQGMLLGSYFYGYAFASLIAGWFSENFDTVFVLSSTTIVAAILVALVPLLAPIHWSIIFVNRILCGALGALCWPCCHTLISRWSPLEERGKFTSMLLGSGIGIFANWTFLGAIIPVTSWMASFYIVSAVSILWALEFWVLCYQSPELHPKISEEEIEYIKSSLKSVTMHKGYVTPPIGKILTNRAFWAFLILHYGSDSGLFFMLTLTPKYMKEGLDFGIELSGLFSGCPGAARMLLGIVFGIVGDRVVQRHKENLSAVRKFFVLFSHIAPGTCLAVMTLCDEKYRVIAVILMSIGIGFNAATILTNNTNNQDLSPNFAGSLYGYANACGSTSGVILPYVTGLILETGNTLPNWHKTFYVCAALYWTTAAVFLLFGSASVQDFNDYYVAEGSKDEGVST